MLTATFCFASYRNARIEADDKEIKQFNLFGGVIKSFRWKDVMEFDYVGSRGYRGHRPIGFVALSSKSTEFIYYYALWVRDDVIVIKSSIGMWFELQQIILNHLSKNAIVESRI